MKLRDLITWLLVGIVFWALILLAIDRYFVWVMNRVIDAFVG